MKKLNEEMAQRDFVFEDRHILWNWEKSPSDNSHEDRGYVRYHFVITDNRFIEEKVEKIQQIFQEKSIMNYQFIEANRLEGKFKQTGLKYLFVSFDTEYTPQFLSFDGISNNVKKDPNLRERKGLSIYDYVRRIYE